MHTTEELIAKAETVPLSDWIAVDENGDGVDTWEVARTVYFKFRDGQTVTVGRDTLLSEEFQNLKWFDPND